MFDILRRVWEFNNKEMTPRDEFYCMWGYYPEDSPLLKKEPRVSVRTREDIISDISKLVYSSVDQGDDPELRRLANQKIDELKSVYGWGDNPRRECWNRLYDLMEKYAAVRFKVATLDYIAKKEGEGQESSPTGYPWSWINLAVSNDYWRKLLVLCIEIMEIGAKKHV